MDQKSWGWVLGAVAVGVVAYLVVQGVNASPKAPEADPGAQQEVGVSSPDASSSTSIRWTFVMKGEDASGAPLREVAVTYQGTTHVIGTYQGSCSVVEDSSWPLLENELTGVICWYAGGGSEIGVFYEDGKRIVKVGTLEEGTAESEGVRGGFETVLTLD